MRNDRGGGRRGRDANPDEKPRKPQTIGTLLDDVLRQAGVAERVEQAQIIPEWASLVGPQIAAVTAPQSITGDGTLFVGVTTNAWMTELSLLEPELLRSLNAKAGRTPVKKIRWLLRR
jgi:predicted nucleic acid-binding Zn ribbon protein